MSDEVALPPLPSPSAGPDELREALRSLILWAQAREPLADGNGLDKFLTGSAALSSGLLTYSPGIGVSGGTGGGAFLPGPATSNPADASPPTPISGLTVAEGVAHNLIQWTAPTYTQGGGNGRTIIYAANYSGTGPLPTFENAVEVGTTPGRGVILVVDAEPGVQVHYWAKAETRHPTLQASPTGGTNGVTATAELIEDQHIVNLSVAKLIAGAIGVSEYIESTGFVTAVDGWRINGDGSAEFANVTIRGVVYATSGSIGGISIGATYLRSTNYVAGTSGFTIEDDGAAEFGALIVRNASGNVILNAGASGAAAPPWVVGGLSIGGGIDLTTGETTSGSMQLRSLEGGPGIALTYNTAGAVQIASTSPLNDEVQLAADETTTTVGITPANMSLPLLANTTYVIRGRLMVSSALETTGHVIGCNVPTGAVTVLRASSQETQSANQQRVLNLPSGGSGTVVFTSHFAATQAAPTVFDSGSFSIMEFEAIVMVGATAGIFELVFGSEVSGSSVTLKAGSSMTSQALKAGVSTPIALAGTPAYTTPISALQYRGSSRPATAVASINILRDGTWSAQRTGGATTTGNWAASTSANVGLQWQVKFAPTVGTLTSNSAPDWTTIGATASAQLRAFSPTGSGTVVSESCTVEIRLKNILTGAETTAGSVVLTAEAESDGDPYAP